jgi:hypothetical protein
LISVLLLLGLILFANVIASISRQNTLKRIYREEVALEIDRALLAHQINRSSFEQLGYKILPQRAVLLAFFEPLEEVLTDDPRSYAENYPDDYDGDKNPEMKKQG